jgi:hypothetical protein
VQVDKTLERVMEMIASSCVRKGKSELLSVLDSTSSIVYIWFRL